MHTGLCGTSPGTKGPDCRPARQRDAAAATRHYHLTRPDLRYRRRAALPALQPSSRPSGPAEHRIGAVVVSHDGTTVDGIASERDIVQALAGRGAAVMSEPVTAICTAEVHTVTPQTPIEEVMRMMTDRKVRHVPVVAGGSWQGIVSIGDVVKIRLGELETERTALTDYITGAH